MPDSFYEEERGVRGPDMAALNLPPVKIKLRDLLDSTFAKVVAQAPIKATRITTATTTVVKAGPGEYFGILIGQNIASGAVEIFNSLTATGTIVQKVTNLATLKADQVSMTLPIGVAMTIGITVRTTGAQDVTILWR
jgi:hypothetical protein